MAPIILPLDSSLATLGTAGGKGQNLAKLAQAGFLVPPGFIVTTAAYRTFVAANGLQPFINGQLSIVNSQWSMEDAASAIRAQFAAVPIPADLVDQILATYHALPPALTIDNSQLTSDRAPVAVRSSATAEDLPDLSFAGQQDTFLNVVGDDALLDAVVRCWSSLWTARAIAYRARNGISHASVALAVIVQAMIESEASGVLFTANPLTGKRDETVVDATVGLGEALVSGQVEPDHYAVNLAADRIVSKHLGAKARSTRSQRGGGVVTVDEPIQGNARQALPGQAILELARLGQDVAQLYAGQPQDIEWAWADGRLFVLQSRPITSLYPLLGGLPAGPLQVFFSLNHAQGMLDPFTPLGQDAILRVFIALARWVDRDFAPQKLRHDMVVGERIYLNITSSLRHRQARTLAMGILGAIEPGAGQVLTALLNEPDLAINRHGISPATLRTLAQFGSVVGPRVAAALRNPVDERVALQRVLESFVVDVSERARQATTLGQRMELWHSIYLEFADRVSLRLLPPVMAGIASFLQLRRLAQHALGSDHLALEVARSLPNNVTTEMDLALWAVTQVIRADPASAERVAAMDPGDVVADFQGGRLPMPAQVALQAFLDRFGVRGLAEIDLGRPRWREDPAHVVQVVQSYLRIGDPDLAPDAVFRRGVGMAESAIDRLARAMPNPAQARLVRFLASRMRALAGLRETPKFTIMRVMAIVRRMMLASGQELAEAGVLAQPDDVFFLHFEELETLAAGGRQDWRALAAERRRAYARELLRRQVPRILLSDGRAFYEGLRATAGAEGVLVGSPVSPGVVEGVVQVVFDPRHAQLAPGEILVCPGTDPSWTPLFLTAGGLVMEVGGLMTHGSVVAREYGIPAVVGVHEATTRLQTGQRVRVDGTAGRVVTV